MQLKDVVFELVGVEMRGVHVAGACGRRHWMPPAGPAGMRLEPGLLYREPRHYWASRSDEVRVLELISFVREPLSTQTLSFRPPPPDYFPHFSQPSASARVETMAPIPVKIKHAGKVLDVQLDPDQQPVVFKDAVYQVTGVPPERMKVMIKGGVLKVCHASLCVVYCMTCDALRTTRIGGKWVPRR